MTGAVAASPPRRAGRSALAVAAGFLATALFSVGTDAVLHAAGVFPPSGQAMGGGLFILATAYRTVFTVAGGWITARLAPGRPVAHVLWLGAIGTVMATAGTLATWDKGPEFGPHWYPVALVVLALPSVWAGGWLAAQGRARPR